MVIDYGTGEKEIVVSLYSLVVYEIQFGTDMIHDCFGKVSVLEDESEPVMDFTQTNWTAVCKALWACERASDPNTEPFEAWSKAITDFRVGDIANVLLPELYGRLFRGGAGDSEKTQGQ